MKKKILGLAGAIALGAGFFFVADTKPAAAEATYYVCWNQQTGCTQCKQGLNCGLGTCQPRNFLKTCL